MERRKFIINTAIAAAGAAIVPSILMDSNSNKKTNIILCILSGGVRNQETINGNGMPLLFSDEILSKSTLYKGFRYNGNVLEHANAHHAIINGNYNYEAHHTKKSISIIPLNNADIAHYNYDDYVAVLNHNDKSIYNLWKNNLNKDNTVMITIPDLGRNNYHNEMNGIDHYDDSAKDIFCMITGPKHLIHQGKIITETTGETIDIAPTLSYLQNNKHHGYDGKVLGEALV